MSTAFYKLFVPGQSTATAETILFDLYNIAGSGLDINVHQVYPVTSGDVALTGTLAPDLFLVQTSAVGVSGTEATVNGSTITATTIVSYGHTNPIDLTKVSARLTPTSGATGAGIVGWSAQFTEETSAASYSQTDMLKRGNPNVPPLRLRSGRGVKVVMGSIGTSGTIGFDVLFSTQPA